MTNRLGALVVVLGSSLVIPLGCSSSSSSPCCTATINGHTGPIDDAAWQSENNIMASGGTVRARPSVLTQRGTAFTVTWEHP